MRNLQIPPIFIASPVRRSGTTLLQRLLCSAENAIIYGENCANDLHLLSNLLASKHSILDQTKNWRNRQLQSVLEGDVNDWIADLMPDVNTYLEVYKNLLITLTDHFGNFAYQQGRPVWGVKKPEWNPAALILLQQLIPEMKIIYLHRNLKDCARSAKKIEMIQTPEDLHQFCYLWKQFTENATKLLKGKNVLHLAFEDLTSSPDNAIKQIEAFTNAKNIDKSVMEIKINTHDGDPNLGVGDGLYLKPASLSDGEMAIIKSYTANIQPELQHISSNA